MKVKLVSATCVRSGQIIFDNISFELRDGQLGYVSGSNGSGKTSLLRMIAGFVPLGSGILSITPDRSEGLFILGHKLAIKEDISPKDDISFWSSYFGSNNKYDVLKKVGLSGVRETQCKYLSQGQRQRLGIARLLSSKSKLWLLDEPSSSLDKSGILLLEEIIYDHMHEGGIVIVSSHNNFLDKVDININLDNRNDFS